MASLPATATQRLRGWPPRTGLVSALGATDGYDGIYHQSSPRCKLRRTPGPAVSRGCSAVVALLPAAQQARPRASGSPPRHLSAACQRAGAPTTSLAHHASWEPSPPGLSHLRPRRPCPTQRFTAVAKGRRRLARISTQLVRRKVQANS